MRKPPTSLSRHMNKDTFFIFFLNFYSVMLHHHAHTVLDVVGKQIATDRTAHMVAQRHHSSPTYVHIDIDWSNAKCHWWVGGFATCSKRESNSWSFFFFHPLPPP